MSYASSTVDDAAKEEITREDVLKAIAEFDELGQDAFLQKYSMGKATGYLLHHGDNVYDSKAILAAAHGFHPGLSPPKSDEFYGGESDAGEPGVHQCDCLVIHDWA